MDHDVASAEAGDPATDVSPEAAALGRIAMAIDVLRAQGEPLDAGRIAGMASADPVVVDAYLGWIQQVRVADSDSEAEAIVLVRTEVFDAIRRTTNHGGSMPTEHDPATPAPAAEGGTKPDPRNARTVIADSIAAVRKAATDPAAAETPAPAAGKRRRRGPYASCFDEALSAIEAVDSAEKSGSGVAAAVDAAEAAMRKAVATAKRRIAEVRKAAQAI